jgi:hypothetical protein
METHLLPHTTHDAGELMGGTAQDVLANDAEQVLLRVGIRSRENDRPLPWGTRGRERSDEGGWNSIYRHVAAWGRQNPLAYVRTVHTTRRPGLHRYC